MNLYKISAEDRYEALEKISALFIKEKNPAVILYDRNSQDNLISHFITYYDITLKEPESFNHSGNIAVYSKEDFPLALMAFPLLVNKKYLFIEKSRFNTHKSKGHIILLGNICDLPGHKTLKTREDIIKFSGKSSWKDIVIINSSDMDSKETPFISDYRCPSLSLLGSYICAIKKGIIYDSVNVNSGLEIEKKINISTEYKHASNITVVGTPGSLPFVQTFLPDFIIGYNWKTDVIRDYTIFEGDYVKSSQGRIHGLNILDCSLLFQKSFLSKKLRKNIKLKGISSSDSVTCLEEMGAAAEVPTLRTSACFISKNLKNNGWHITELYGKDNRYSNIIENLKKSLLCYIGNHGILLYIRCAEKCLGAGDLPLIPPVQIYCFSCITTRTTGLWLSSNEIDWTYSDVPVEKNIPFMSIRQGASSFMGMLMCGLELEGDILVSEIMKYMQFGYTLGEAVKEAKNTLTATVKSSLMMTEREAYGNYELSKYYNQITVYECEIYGDPDIKLPGKAKSIDHLYINAKFNVRGKINISINIPEDKWEELQLPVGEKSQGMYYTKNFRTLYPRTPFSVLAGHMPVEKDAETFIAKESIGYYNFKIKLQLNAGETVKYVELKRVNLLDATDFDGNILDIKNINPFEIFGYGRIKTSIFKDSVKTDIRHNWPFTVDGDDLYIFIPTAMVADEKRIIARLKSASFTVHCTRKSSHMSGKITSSEELPVNAYLTFTNKEGKKRKIDTDSEGNYSAILPYDEYSMLIEEKLHYDYKGEITIKEKYVVKNIHLTGREKIPVNLKISDSITDEEIKGATVNIMSLFGPTERKMIEEYVKGKERYPHRFIKECLTDNNGNIACNLPEGDYIADIYKKKENGKGALYLRKEEFLEVRKDKQNHLYKIKPAATIFGQIVDKHTGNGIPDSTLIVKYPGSNGKEKKLRFHTNMEGRFGAVVPADQKLKLTGVFEGFTFKEEDNDGKGIVLHKGETFEIILVGTEQ
ncbi:MAG: hypothetical protein ABRQ38_24810 [Candidatus Eremiobacterota bacterium]